MALYMIIKCPKCGNYVAVRENSKSFTCPYCRSRSSIINKNGKPILKIYTVIEGRKVPEFMAAIKSGKIKLED